MTYFQAAAHVVGAHASMRLAASRNWARLASHLLSAPLEAYQYCMTLLPQVVWLGTSATDQHSTIFRDVQDLIAMAAFDAISLQQYDLALEWLEQGRSIVWGQLLQLRTPLDELSDRCPELAVELQQVSSELERASMFSPSKQPAVVVGALLRDTSLEHRRLAQRREQLLMSARALPGLEDLLLPPKARKLADLVKEGVAVVVNIHKFGCDAIIIQARAPAISHISLAEFSFEKAEQLHKELKSCLTAQGSRRGVRRVGRKPSFSRILDSLWHEVVKPVIGHLGITYDPLLKDLPHITWCTTGPLSFLPLHAAGDYNHPSTALPYLAISSYTPTISGLAQPCGSSPDAFSGLLAVGHESSVRGLSPLPGVKAELDKVASYAAGIKMTRLDEENACADAVLQALSDHSWVHFACHGSQNPSEPMKSALHLHDQDLTLSTIIGTRPKNAQLAFLSACQTAAGDTDLPDESIHLAAGLLMAGYPTVIATMWSIDDRDAPLVAEKVYKCLLDNNVPDSRKAAKALHEAVASLRENIGVDHFERWVPYIHVGR
ncbi:hypothetical protein FRC09_020982 [Ceratobasidium sp. 395]|nr:hypothetical protein FRC09_020982 [Ceratobasidium sp. 395]